MGTRGLGGGRSRERVAEAGRRRGAPGGCLTRVLHIIHVSTCNFSLPAASAATTAAAVSIGKGRHCYAGRVVKTPKTKAKPKSKRAARAPSAPSPFSSCPTRSQQRGAKRASLYATISKPASARKWRGRGRGEYCVCVCGVSYARTRNRLLSVAALYHIEATAATWTCKVPGQMTRQGKAGTASRRWQQKTRQCTSELHFRNALTSMRLPDQPQTRRAQLNRDLSLRFVCEFISNGHKLQAFR